ERLLLDAAQNGTLDLPAKVHAPIETFIVARLCETPVTPMQITLVTAAISAVTAVLFARGELLAGTVLALIVGVLDGVDGKLARVKVETTELGKREHLLDYVLELSWWTTLAYHWRATRQVPAAYALLLLLVSADVVDRLAKKKAKELTGRNLDDVAPVDRFVRLIGGRRNIYIWMLAAALPFGLADRAFVAACWWGAATAAVHLLRVGWLARPRRAS
ncbi:MAG: CDP-alcohol phosphatidyltransferase family protein, partial [Verrucomicrobiota bacterium]|nr:CDP-alcohol phosphatidyltransferase family protein [Verrucomicrobiota bacterium]